MSTTKLEVYKVNCDGCGEELTIEDAAITLHFDSIATIGSEIRNYGWSGDTINGVARHYCETCTCARAGHPAGRYGCFCGDPERVWIEKPLAIVEMPTP